ncbi:hybrid sensor histidine kinase/response regulator [Roseibium sp. M-1]
MADQDEKSVELALLAHDLRTPLAAMRLTAELIGSGELSDSQQEQLSILIRSIDALTQMTGELVAAADPAAATDGAPGRIGDIVAEVADLFRVAARAKGLDFDVSIAGSLGEVRTFKAGTLRRVITTLIDNAVKYTSDGGISVGLADSGPDRIRISVTDSGPGIDLEERARLFRPFVRGRRGREAGPGTGLGLWGTEQMVRDMNGRLILSSPEGGGSRFEVEIPVDADGLAGQPDTGVAVEEGRKTGLTGPLSAHVLIVDDNETNCRLLSALLESFGISSDVARSGEQAIGLVQKDSYDAVLLDLHMPGMSGLETAMELRALGSAGNVPLIAVTAALESVGDKRLREAGFQETLTKPLSPAALFQAMEQAVRPLGSAE